MPVLLLILAVAVFAYLYWRSRTTSLTRECRWRQHRDQGQWSCSFCGAISTGEDEPTRCLKDQA